MAPTLGSIARKCFVSGLFVNFFRRKGQKSKKRRRRRKGLRLLQSAGLKGEKRKSYTGPHPTEEPGGAGPCW